MCPLFCSSSHPEAAELVQPSLKLTHSTNVGADVDTLERIHQTVQTASVV